jgi:hypothetical protein
MKTRKVIYADDGYVLTDGEIYGRQIFLADDVSDRYFYEITEEEYENILYEQRKRENLMLGW